MGLKINASSTKIDTSEFKGINVKTACRNTPKKRVFIPWHD